MSKQIRDLDARLDRAAEQIRDRHPDPSLVEAATARVWATLAEQGAAGRQDRAPAIDEIRSCEDYQALIPAYLAGDLAASRHLLVDDHLRSCVPCRRALKAVRAGEPLVPAVSPPASVAAASPERAITWLKWGSLAAALVVALGTAWLALDTPWPFGEQPRAVVQTADGGLFRVAANSQVPIAVGDQITEGEVLRTGRDSSAVIQLHDGSLVEMRERSEFAFDRRRKGTTVDLARGSVIVQAAQQHDGHLYVRTDDCLVTVTGTIFSVNHGTKGSRVSVIEGEVKVAFTNDETTLRPGDQVTTQSALSAVPVGEEIAWSREVDRYLDLLREFTDLGQELKQTVPQPELRYASRLLDLQPPATAIYVAFPNLGETVTETHRVIRDRIGSSAALQEWWQQNATGLEPAIDSTVAKIGRFAEFLGAEIVVSGQLPAQGDDPAPLVMAEIREAAGLREFIEEELETFQHGEDEVVFVDQPLMVEPSTGAIFVWLHDDLLVATPAALLLADVARVVFESADNGFVGSEFHTLLSERYEDGVGILIAADLERVVDSTMAEGGSGREQRAEHLERTGIDNARHLIVEQKRYGDLNQHRAEMTFSDTRHGVASWLAEPAPMASLEFISPDAKLVAAMVFKNPVALMDDITSWVGGSATQLEALASFEERYGLSLRDDFAAVFGGELTLALDGPMLPEPSWKASLEVYDPARFQWTVEQAIAEVNDHLRQDGKPDVTLEQERSGSRTYYRVGMERGEIHYTFVEGYLVLAPSRALVEQALRYRESGYSIVDSPRFTALMPTDGQNNFSALVYHDFSSLAQGIAEGLTRGNGLSPEQRQALEGLRSQITPTLGYAYGKPDRIVAAATTETDALSSVLMGMLGMSNPVGLQEMLEQLGEELH